MNFRQVRKKIKTIGNVKQITKAMQMVSSVKMKKAQNQAIEGRVYRDFLDSIMKKIMAKTDIDDAAIMSLINVPESAKKDLCIVISSNKGLCGSFNAHLFKKIVTVVNADECDVVSVGKKGADFFTRFGMHIAADFSGSHSALHDVSAIFSFARDSFISGTYRTVYLAYNRFVSTMQQVPTVVTLFPIKPEEVKAADTASDQKSSEQSYLIEPSPAEVFESLFFDYIEGKIRQAILDSEASEHSSRMMAMKKATDSAADIIFNLTLLRNKLRQTSITNELLDITTAKISTDNG